MFYNFSIMCPILYYYYNVNPAVLLYPASVILYVCLNPSLVTALNSLGQSQLLVT